MTICCKNKKWIPFCQDYIISDLSSKHTMQSRMKQGEDSNPPLPPGPCASVHDGFASTQGGHCHCLTFLSGFEVKSYKRWKQCAGLHKAYERSFIFDNIKMNQGVEGIARVCDYNVALRSTQKCNSYHNSGTHWKTAICEL